MAQTDVLTENQFAIQRGATFTFDNAGTIVKVSEDGAMSITLNFKIKDKADIQNTPGQIMIGASGVFTKGDLNRFSEGSSVSDLSLSVDDLKRIRFISDENDIELITTADKGRQGNAIMLKQE